MTEVPFNPAVKDGRGTRGLAVPKSNWANPIDTAAVRGLRRDLRRHLHLRRAEDHHRAARSRAPTAAPIPGLFAAGELVGGLFYHNYPGGTGLVSGAVLGKLAGDGAGKLRLGQELVSPDRGPPGPHHDS